MLVCLRALSATFSDGSEFFCILLKDFLRRKAYQRHESKYTTIQWLYFETLFAQPAAFCVVVGNAVRRAQQRSGRQYDPSYQHRRKRPEHTARCSDQRRGWRHDRAGGPDSTR
ncbi:MAG: hypothetical protein DME26_19645 [Verrucomicrobia bacterium]|nr:MAG: hypothetical protein DME26_19645 [Verrucomicrobiota bacterium]